MVCFQSERLWRVCKDRALRFSFLGSLLHVSYILRSSDLYQVARMQLSLYVYIGTVYKSYHFCYEPWVLTQKRDWENMRSHTYRFLIGQQARINSS